jgi:membrane-bound lytic murein transglycosylase MltF
MLITRRQATATIAAVLALSPERKTDAEAVALSVHLKPNTSDLDTLLKLGAIRVLVPYSRTFFFEDKGRFYGVSANVADELERYVRKTFPASRYYFVVVVVPTSRDRLLPDLLAGKGDVAVGDITITPEREKQVRFTTPTFTDVTELVMTRAGMAPMTSVDDLSGKDIAARRTTSTYASLVALNERLKAAGRPLTNILDVPPTLEVEDMMEMVASGLLPAIPAEDWVAKTWAPLIPGLMIHDKAVLRSAANLGWAVRPSNPKLLAMLNAFIAKFGGGSARELHDTAMYYVKRAKKIYAATNPEEMKKFDATLAFFQKYGPEYGFDGLMLVAQGYEESHLNQSARSLVGAVGLMQLMPSTGKEMGVGNIFQADANVHAGAKYMHLLIERYLKDESFDEQNRTLFAFACYNAGPAKIAELRKEAREGGLNDNIWFDNVERAAAHRIGQETVQYVRSIYKYYIGYKLVLESKQREAVGRVQVTAPAISETKPTQ